ncbi:hypothetical protein CsSME_00018680 [Camellia sinensis var. sinensis]|uniref:Olee1-like protein n=1 Tax=Camellia sinensis var. sinensis TaxID=542762 RepID=A0A4S4EUG4_CAMSN|nr:anther-specific protein LAT52-like [Camellia sinensis]THG20114.1 hypothetical protein TEA_026074 [Camellia sinensis var. sinensis]
MAKAFVALITSALCLLAFAGFANCQKDEFFVEGYVYCDTCRVLFETRVSHKVPDAEVELNCRGQDNHTVTYTVSGKADKEGKYSLKVTGDHQDEICDVTAVNSPDTDCNESVSDINKARISLTGNSGMESTKRFANPIGFRKKDSLADCKKVLDELGFVPLQN